MIKWCVGWGKGSSVVFLCPFSSDSSGQLNVLGHNCDPFGVNGTQVGIFKQADQVSFTGFLYKHKKGKTISPREKN